MLETLSEDLLARVLAWLPAKDLKRARLAFRAADAVAREELDTLTTLALAPKTTARGGPDWTRWPQLARIQLCRWGSTRSEAAPAAERQRLLGFFLSPAGTANAADVVVSRSALARVTYLDLQWFGDLDPATLAALLRVLPGLRTLALPGGSEDGQHAAALLRAAAAHAPRLRALKIDHTAVPDDDEEVPFDEWRPTLAALSVRALPWPGLRELHGVVLRADDVALIAAGLPWLRQLIATPAGEWHDFVPAAGFARVTYARFNDCYYGFDGAPFAALLPAVRSLLIERGECFDIPAPFDFRGLTALTALNFGAVDHFPDTCQRLAGESLTDLAALPALTHLGVTLDEDALPLLALLAPKLAALDLCIIPHDHYNIGDRPLFLDGALAAVAPLTGLTALRFNYYTDEPHRCRPEASPVKVQSQASISAFPGMLPRLRRLVLGAVGLRSYELSVLCAHLALRELAANLAKGEDWAAFRRLAADHAPRGLELRTVYCGLLGDSFGAVYNDAWEKFGMYCCVQGPIPLWCASGAQRAITAADSAPGPDLLL